MTMYFDDVSRSPKETIKWSPTGFELTHIGTSSHGSNDEGTGGDLQTNAANEKLDAVQRLLIGYDSESASSLSLEEGTQMQRIGSACNVHILF